jgi:hypothetical protein
MPIGRYCGFSSQFLTQALIRDGYRCVFTGLLDKTSYKAHLVKADGTGATPTQLAHIFDRSTNENLGVENKVFTSAHPNDPSFEHCFAYNLPTIQKDYAASAHAVLSQFGQINAIEDLNGENVH